MALEEKWLPLQISFANSSLYTVTARGPEATSSTPVVFVHGFGAGVALWCSTLGVVAQRRTAHAFDLLGPSRRAGEEGEERE